MDMEMLEAIGQMMDAKLKQQKQDIMGETKTLLTQQKQDMMGETKTLLAQQKQEIKTELRQELMHDMKVLLDTEVATKFNLLAEGIEDIQRRMPNEDDMDIIDGRLADLEADVALLKKAN